MKRRIDPVEPPCKKTVYNTQEDALDMIKHIRETRIGPVIRVYKCPVCGFWHLTSSKPAKGDH